MSRTHHRITPDKARKRRVLRDAVRRIEDAWTYTEWFSRRRVRRRARDIAHAFRRHLMRLEGADWWRAVAYLEPWLPGSSR